MSPTVMESITGFGCCDTPAFGKCSQIETLERHIGDELWELVLAEPTGLGQWFCYFALSAQHPFMGLYQLFLL